VIDEGYVKYKSNWIKAGSADSRDVAILEEHRQVLWRLRLIGHDAFEGVGYGNLSVRHTDEPHQFVISGTQTGRLRTTNKRHYSVVVGYSIEHNLVSCAGPVQASSESLTHAALYEADEIKAIVHVHDIEMWSKYKGLFPTTREDVRYGTPEMARELQTLYEETEMKSGGVAVMLGHEGGLISVGSSLAVATMRMLDAYHYR